MSRKLHIGGKQRTPGWEVLDALPAPHVDHVRNATDLSIFSDDLFDQIYASHVVEHFDYQGELVATLREWLRVLKPGGSVLISVPDLDVLARMFADRSFLDAPERFQIMRMMFGGHLNPFDYHVVGLNEEFLGGFLQGAGFTNIRRVEALNLFNDTSTLRVKGVLISLNMIADKPYAPA